MADEITHNHTSGQTLYFCCFQPDGDVFLTGGASDEVWGTGGRTADDYDEAMAEEGTSGHYKGSMAAGIGAGVYQIQVRNQAGANPADADIAIGQGEIYWDGTNEVNIYTLSETDVAAITAKLPTNYIMGSSTQDDQDTIIHGGTVPDNTSTADSIKLAATASAANDIYNENIVVLISGTGAGQSRLIADYVGATKTAVVRNSWVTTPDNTTVYRIYPFSGILLANTGICAGAGADTITLNASAPATADIYDGHTVYISGGTGAGQARIITGYSAGRVATVYPAWDVQPAAAASVYIILPIGVGEVYDTLEDMKGTGFVKDTDSLVNLAHTGADGDTLETLSDEIAALNDITADDVHDEVIEGTVTFRQAIRLIMAVLTGKSSGGGTTEITFRDIQDTKDRLVLTVDGLGNRSNVGTRDGT